MVLDYMFKRLKKVEVEDIQLVCSVLPVAGICIVVVLVSGDRSVAFFCEAYCFFLRCLVLDFLCSRRFNHGNWDS